MFAGATAEKVREMIEFHFSPNADFHTDYLSNDEKIKEWKDAKESSSKSVKRHIVKEVRDKMKLKHAKTVQVPKSKSHFKLCR